MKPSEFAQCFQGVVPSVIATADRHGTPNVTYVSQVYLIDDRHVALSCQFFNKTRRNLDENPRVLAEVYDPVTFQAYRLRLRFLRSEKTGPLFEAMAIRIQAIASLTGMSGVFKLIAADVFEVERVEFVDGFLTDVPAQSPRDEISLTGLRTELRGLQWVSDRINRACTLDLLLASVLEALEEYFAFAHTMVLMPEDDGRLVAIASRGYGQSGIGAEVKPGEGLIGTVARERRVLRITNLNADLRYGRAIRREAIGQRGSASPEIPLPGLADARSALVIPLLLEDRLIGVLAAESRDPMRFGDWHEAYLEIIGNQIALGIDRMMDEEDSDIAEAGRAPAAPPVMLHAREVASAPRTFTYYRNDDVVFVDGEYLIRNVPGRILWKLLREWQREGRTDFSNRELRLDESLGLPPIKDNLESRLILLRKRLEEKCEEVRIVPTGRGKFALNVAPGLDLVEK